MNAAEFFVIQHGRSHAADVGGPGSKGDRTAGGLPDAMHLGERAGLSPADLLTKVVQ
jgi:hypothetical protein